MAILLPTLQKVRSQARAVACQSNLRQWGVIFSIYVNDNVGKLPKTEHSSSLRADPGRRSVKLYNVDINIYKNNFIFCPMATRRELRPDNNKSRTAGPNKYERIVGSKSTPWCIRRTYTFPTNARPPEVTEFSGSYGLNGNISGSSIDIYPGSVRNNVPVFLDCRYMCGWSVRHFDEPPEYEEHFKYIFSPTFGDITYFCINRHSGRINSLFLDWSVRKVGLKELWTLKWKPKFDTASVWTKAGGVLPEDWPKWMRGFKDY